MKTFIIKKFVTPETKRKLPERIKYSGKHKQNKKMKNLQTNLIGIFCISCFLSFVSYGQNSTRKIEIKKDHMYLNFPVTESNDLKKTRIIVDGKVIDEFTISLSEGEPDFWTFFNVSKYRGKTITIEAENIGKQQKGFDKIFAGSNFPGQDSLYKESLRPQVHFSSRRGWHNDPNGLIFYKGEYHLFYQHNPYGWRWGNMHWGHAVSKDLLRWKETGEALYTPNHDDMAFSGSAVTDINNTSGFRKNGIDPLLAFFTSTGRGECLAMSYNNGRTFKDYESNPVIKHKGRDPKVFWYAPANHWVMVVYDESHAKNKGSGLKAMMRQLSFYTSPDLRNWTYQSGIPGFFECPELFELPVEGAANNKKWVIYAANGKYKIGNFNGEKFTVEQDFRTYDNGGAFYASQTYNNIPAADSRRIQIGWARIPLLNMPFNQCMTFPTELKLKKSFDGYRLCPQPIKEIKTLHKGNHIYNDIILNESAQTYTAPVKGDVLHIVAEFERGDASEFGLNINGYELTYSNLFQDFNKINYPVAEDSVFKIEAIVDKTIAEIFINNGDLYFVKPLNTTGAEKIIKAYANGLEGGHKTILKKLEVNELNTVWKEKGK